MCVCVCVCVCMCVYNIKNSSDLLCFIPCNF